MSRYKPEKFNYSHMSEKITFLTQSSDGTYAESLRCWAHLFKDGFTRSENDNFFKIMVREQKSIVSLLSRTTRVKWRGMLFNVFSWQDPSYEDRGFMEIIVKQIPGDELGANGNIIGDSDLFKDIISLYRLKKVSKISYGIETFEYVYDFSVPLYTNIKCWFSTDRNIYLDDKRTDIEKDSLVVKFNTNADIRAEDYIESPFHGRFKVDMVTRNEENYLEARVQRREVQ